jgi:hypothetical protein
MIIPKYWVKENPAQLTIRHLPKKVDPYMSIYYNADGMEHINMTLPPVRVLANHGSAGVRQAHPPPRQRHPPIPSPPPGRPLCCPSPWLPALPCRATRFAHC